jgi:hypothetical protein
VWPSVAQLGTPGSHEAQQASSRPLGPPLLLFLLPLPPLRRLLFLFWLLLLGSQDGAEGCGLGARGAVLV